MAIYAVGDVQGCVAPLEEMLEKLRFEPARDVLWLTGDLVNRGRHSLQTLRLIKGLGPSAITVLGNHDLHLLAVAAGIKSHRVGDTMKPILKAPDRDELLHWLRHRPLVHWDNGRKARAKSLPKSLLVHAGIYPGWRRKEVVRFAAEVETLLRGDDYREFLKHMYGQSETRWDESAGKWQRARFITNALTRIRFCTAKGDLDFNDKGSPGKQSQSLQPWFDHPKMKCKGWRIVFGHWSAQGYIQRDNLIGLDSGCVWGNELTAVRLDGGRKIKKKWQVNCKGYAG